MDGENPSHQPFRIILIEDESSVLSALSLLLDAMGFEVRGYSDPTEAVAYMELEDDPADLCLCDLRMPKLGGLQVLEKVRARHPMLPFVLMSAHAKDEELRQALSLGIQGTLSKPFAPDELQALIGQIRSHRI
jgi:DNA-binding NtrC family response regulator